MKALAALLVLLGLTLLADRVAEGVAEERVRRELAATGGLRDAPGVDITGFPFVTQAVAGRYDDVRISLSADQLAQPEGTRADVVLRGVRLPLSAVLSGAVREVPVERVEGTATLSYALLSTRLGAGTVLRRDGDQLRITRTVELLGRPVPLTAVGEVTVEGSELVIDVDGAAGAGIELPAFLVEQAGDLLDLRHPVPALPFGLRLTGVAPAEDGVTLRVEATDIVLGVVE